MSNPKPTKMCLSRLMAERKKIMNDRDPQFDAAPDPQNILKWCFVFDGAIGTPFEGGRYVGQLLFEHDFPMRAPSIMMLTPNGRFSTNTSLCLSNTSFHPEMWNPLWGVGTIVMGLISFMNCNEGGIGSLTDSEAQRRLLAKGSRKYNVTNLRQMYQAFLPEAFECDVLKVEDVRRSELAEAQIKSQVPPSQRLQNSCLLYFASLVVLIWVILWLQHP